MNVLIVDDSPVQRRLMASFLPQHPRLRVREAGDGKEALALLRESAADLILTDWNMPEVDGLELIRHLRSQERYRATRIVMITTNNEQWSVIRAIRAGADEYIMKPFDQGILRSKLAAVYGSEHPLFGGSYDS